MLILVQHEYHEPTAAAGVHEEALVLHRHEHLNPEAMAIFVHGLGGTRYGTRQTWGHFPHFVFEDFPQLDVGLYEYATLHGRRPWASVSLETESRVLAGIVMTVNCPRIVLVGHSMGGLLCKAAIKYLIEGDSALRQSLGRIGGLILMATPQTGSQRVPFLLSWLSQDFWALRPHGDFVTGLSECFANRVSVEPSQASSQSGRFVIPSWAVLGSSDFWVDRLSAGMTLPRSRTRYVRGSHTSIVKPTRKDSDAYEFVKTVLAGVLASDLGGQAPAAPEVRPQEIRVVFPASPPATPVAPAASPALAHQQTVGLPVTIGRALSSLVYRGLLAVAAWCVLAVVAKTTLGWGFDAYETAAVALMMGATYAAWRLTRPKGHRGDDER
jgi:pimeloyl-ACP methyl ester carboxylesterase